MEVVRQLLLILDLFLSRNYITNIEWRLLGVSLHYDSIDNHPSFEVQVHLQREWTALVINIVTPCFLFSMLSMLAFVLPEESGEKVGFIITLLLAMTTFAQLSR